MTLKLLVLVFALSGMAEAQEWRMQPLPIATRWAVKVGPSNALPEYPRPQMVRPHWQNLNGLWSYAITEKNGAPPTLYPGKILVPYPLESALSGVEHALLPSQNLWYQRTFTAPAIKDGERVLLHFGAVDFEATVLINDVRIGQHSGGYQNFSFDITRLLKKGVNDIKVKVWDPTEQGPNPHGKQSLKPQGIFYTATSGIWQTVWFEKVPETYIESLVVTPNLDQGSFEISVLSNAPDEYTVEVAADKTTTSGPANRPLLLRIVNPKLWSPEHPHLYDLTVRLLKRGVIRDAVHSYAGMRKIDIKKDEKGKPRIYLNNQYTFNLGVLDQGFWPDGIYTAPTDAALEADIATIKAMGFNTIRKHVKIEPARWYYFCDMLGMLVWQDMVPPSGSSGGGDAGQQSARAQFESEVTETLAQLHNYPSVVAWVLFNEGWGAYDQDRLEAKVKALDPSRLLDGLSGVLMLLNGNIAFSGGVAGPESDFIDIHSYPDPAIFESQDGGKISVLGEFGGVAAIVNDHVWLNAATAGWGYEKSDIETLSTRYAGMLESLKKLEREGLSGSIYTQPFDVEGEQNGLTTYDREITKIPLQRIHDLNAAFLAGTQR